MYGPRKARSISVAPLGRSSVSPVTIRSSMRRIRPRPVEKRVHQLIGLAHTYRNGEDDVTAHPD